MKKLSQNWFIDGLIDAEYKQYILLAYLQEVEKLFSKYLLFPVYDHLQDHYRVLNDFKKKKELLQNHFPMELKDIDLKNNHLIYKSVISEVEMMKTIDEIVGWSIPQIGKYVNEGNKLYTNISENVEIEQVGLIPFNLSFGFLLLPDHKKNKVRVYTYTVALYSSTYGEKEIHTRFITSYNFSLANTPERIKSDLIHHPKLKFSDTPAVPATFTVSTNYNYPVESSLLPVVKTKLLHRIEGR